MLIILNISLNINLIELKTIGVIIVLLLHFVSAKEQFCHKIAIITEH